MRLQQVQLLCWAAGDGPSPTAAAGVPGPGTPPPERTGLVLGSVVTRVVDLRPAVKATL